MSSPRANDSAPKGFKPKPSNTRKDQRTIEGKEVVNPSISTEVVSPTKKENKIEAKIDNVQPLTVPELSQRVEDVKKDIADDQIDNLSSENEDYEEASLKLRLDMEARILKKQMEEELLKKEMETNLLKKQIEEELLKKEMEANLRIQQVKKLANETLLKGEKVFYYPKIVTLDQEIEIFLNRIASSLSEESEILIMGAFNGWRYKSFTVKLNKTNFGMDWWSCKIYVPKEAYRIDFVFFNGKDVYENNEMKDFCISVEGGMDVFEFEELLLVEKRRELERLAKEQAEREKQAIEQKRIEAEKASSEADRAQARGEAERRRELIEQLLEKAVMFDKNVWYIEPSEFKWEENVKLYYNKSVGPLANAKDLWIHGGYNNWREGLSIVEKLEKFQGQHDGDWWYANGMQRYPLSHFYIKIMHVYVFILFCSPPPKFMIKT